MEIKFRTVEGFEWLPEPQPANKALPQWYRQMEQRMDTTTLPPGTFPHGTAKLCSPFGDALGAGYILPLPLQLYVQASENDTIHLSWNHPREQEYALVGEHSKLQLPNVDFPGDHSNIFKFNLPWTVEVPEGYAVLYTHPLNRPDLPFFAFSGVVDWTYKSPVNIPFVWVAGAQETILDAGTPVAQVIPFKVEDWEHEISSAPDGEIYKDARVAPSQIYGYRRHYRQPKTWQ